MTLMRGLGGAEPTRLALSRFRQKVQAADYPDLHLTAIVWGIQILSGEEAITDPAILLTALGFDTVTSYVWIHHIPLPTFPQTPYADVLEEARKHWHAVRAEYPLPYFPNVTMGWDSSPRAVQSDVFENVGYPFMPMLSSNTPEKFRLALRTRKSFWTRSPPGRVC